MSPFTSPSVPLPSVAYVGSKVEVNATLINESQMRGPARLLLRMTAPDGKVQTVSDTQVEIEGDALKFVQPLVHASVVPLGPSGYYRLHAELRFDAGKVLTGEQAILAEDAADWKLPATGLQVEDPTHTLGKYFEAKTIFYPGNLSPSESWQPVLLIYNPEGHDYDSSLWTAERLTREVAERGRTVLFWATDPAHGETVTEVLQELRLLPASAQVVPLNVDWWGGWEFNTPHPIFDGLPARSSMTSISRAPLPTGELPTSRER